MNDLNTLVLTAGLMSGAVLATLPGRSLVADRVPPFPPDNALTIALQKGDSKAVGTLLDESFQWVDVTGTVHTKAEALTNFTTFAAADKGNNSPTELVTRDYGQVQVLRGIHDNQKFGHVWVKRSAGWRAFVYVDTPVRRQSRVFKPQAPRNASICENPCSMVPVTAENVAQQGALTAWMRIKTDEWHANVEDWDVMTDVDHITITESAAQPKAPHLEELAQQRAAFGGANPGTPIISMRLADFGNVVIMTDLEGRNSAKPSGWAMRLFIDRGAGWKICLSIHTTIGDGQNDAAR